MVKKPKDKVDMDDFDSVEEYIATAMDEGYTIEASDFEGRQCFYCGELVTFEEVNENPDALVTWDIEILDDPDRLTRDYFCSEDCKRAAQRDPAYLRDGPEYGDREEIRKVHLEGNR